jgi:hypothetical protein
LFGNREGFPICKGENFVSHFQSTPTARTEIARKPAGTGDAFQLQKVSMKLLSATGNHGTPRVEKHPFNKHERSHFPKTSFRL